MNSKTKGEITEGVVLAHMLKLGYAVLVPFGDNKRYDLVIDRGDGVFIRGQCKTARLVNGCIAFNTSSTNGFTGKRSNYVGEIDVFWVYSPDTGFVYEIGVNDVGKNSCRLRIDSPQKHGKLKTIRWASDFII